MYQFKKILCVVSYSGDNQPLLQQAVSLAEAHQAELTLVSVIEDLPQTLELQEDFIAAEKIIETMLGERRRFLKNLVDSLRTPLDVSCQVLTGTAFISIIHEVLRYQYDLLIKQADSGGLVQRLFGSLDMHLLRKCPVPVWLVKHGAPRVNKRILAALDVNNYYPPKELQTRQQLNQMTLDMADSLAEFLSAEIYAVSVWDAIAEDFLRAGVVGQLEDNINLYMDSVAQRYRNNLHQLLDEMQENRAPQHEHTPTPQAILLKGQPREKIPEFSREIDADLVVMGTVARTGISGLIMGNTAESILHQLDCSVLAIKPPGFVSPVKLDE